MRVQLHLPPLRSLDLAWNPGERGGDIYATEEEGGGAGIVFKRRYFGGV